jgi:hypothetical protein
MVRGRVVDQAVRQPGHAPAGLDPAVGDRVFISARADACLTSVTPMATSTHMQIVTRRKLLRVVEIAEILGVSK